MSQDGYEQGNVSPALACLLHPCIALLSRFNTRVAFILTFDTWSVQVSLDRMIVLFGLGTRQHVRMRTKFENGVLRNCQQLQCAVNGMTWVNFKF